MGRDNSIPVTINMHDAEPAKRFAYRIVGMFEGRVVYGGPPAGLDATTLKTIYGGEGWLQ